MTPIWLWQQGPIGQHCHTRVRTHPLLLSETGHKETISSKVLVYKYLGEMPPVEPWFLSSDLLLAYWHESAQMQVREKSWDNLVSLYYVIEVVRQSSKVNLEAL